MKCSEVRKRLSEHVAGELFRSEQEAIAGHLAQCGACRAEAAVLERCEQALGVLGAVEEAPDRSEDLSRRIAAPLPWRPRWGAAAAVAGVAVAVTAVAVLLLAPPKAPAPNTPIVREAARGPAVVAIPQAAEVKPETPAETPSPTHVPPATVSAPRLVPAEVAPQQVASPTVVSVPDRGAEPAELREDTTIEAAPVMASLTTRSEPAGGVVLLLGRSERARHSSSCYLEVSLPNGARSVFERVAKLEAAGTPRVIEISYEQIAPEPKAQNGGG